MERLSRYSPHKPYAKQFIFLELNCLEALYGGSAGGGKSDALLMGALQYVHVPRYAALILRKDSKRLSLSGGLIPRSHEWLHGKATWNGNNARWTFPNGASIQFGHLDNTNDKYRYGSSEYQYIAFDELTEFSEEDYTFLISRLRKTHDIDVPYRIRGASNPGGIGHDWVRNRFVTRESEIDMKDNALKGVYFKGDRAFVPAKIRDNFAIDPEKYMANLMHLGPVTRERLMNGDWTIMPEGLIKPYWLRYFTMRDQMVDLLISRVSTEKDVLHTSEVLQSFHVNTCRRFITCDTAGGGKNITRESKGKPKSWTVAGVWDARRLGDYSVLMLKHVWRDRLGFTDVAAKLVDLCDTWSPYKVLVENETMGPHLYDMLKGKIPIQCISHEGKDKVTRATQLLNMMELGKVYLPLGENSWRNTLEAEWLSWQGLDDETNDQVDMSAYAAIEVGGWGTGYVQLSVDPRKPFSIKPQHPPTNMLGW